MPQPGQLITLECGQTRSRLLPAALVSVSLGDPRANGVAAWLKLAGKIVRITSSTDEGDHLPANTVDVFLASAAPLARDSGCPPNRVNPNPKISPSIIAGWRGHRRRAR